MKSVRKDPLKRVKKSFKPSWKDFILYGFVAIFILFIVFGITGASSNLVANAPKEVPLSEILNDVEAGKVEELVVTDTTIEANYGGDVVKTTTKETGVSIYEILESSGIDPNDVNIVIEDAGTSEMVITILSAFLPVLLIIGFFYIMYRGVRGSQENVFSFGSNKGKTFNKDFPKVTFADVAGIDEAKEELSEIVDFLKNPKKYTSMGARTPKGVLLIGPAGTGKTLLSRAVAGEAQVPFISIAGSEFMEMLVGVGAARVRDLFITAKKSQPAIIFIDEVDAIGRQRGAGIMGGHDEREQTLNQILVEMDGFTPNEQLVVIAATNRPDILDPALVRPGRFDRRVALSLPDLEGRLAILKIHAKGKPFVKDVNWEKIARRTVGFSGADLENMLNEAAILAARLRKKAIDMKDLEEAATKVKLGPEKRRLQSENDKRITAYHEAGHALVSYYMSEMDPVHRISIVGRGMSLGHTLIPPKQDRVHETRTRLLQQVSVMLGGRVAEELVFSEMTTGASDDIEKATYIARAMVVNFGMSSLGAIDLDPQNSENPYERSTMSDAMKNRVDLETSRIMEDAYKKATALVKKYRKKLDEVSVALLAQETLEAEEFEAIMKGAVARTSKKTP